VPLLVGDLLNEKRETEVSRSTAQGLGPLPERGPQLT